MPEYYLRYLSWNPLSCGVNINELEKKRSAGRPYRILRYSIRCHMREVQITYRTKIWALENGNVKDPTKRRTVFSEVDVHPTEQQQISHTLQHSLYFGDDDPEGPEDSRAEATAANSDKPIFLGRSQPAFPVAGASHIAHTAPASLLDMRDESRHEGNPTVRQREK